MCSCCICRWTRSKPPWFRWASQPQNDKDICLTMCELWITLTTRQILSINSTNTKLWTWSNKRFRACQRIEALGGSRPPGPDVCSPDLIDQQNHTRPPSRQLSILKRVPQNRCPPFEACKSYQGHCPRHICSRVSVHNWSAMKHRSSANVPKAGGDGAGWHDNRNRELTRTQFEVVTLPGMVPMSSLSWILKGNMFWHVLAICCFD